MQNIYVEISFAILIFLIVLDQTLRGGDGKWLQGRMHDSKCDPEEKVILHKEEMNYSTDHVLHKTKSVTVIYIWISIT